MQADTQFRTGGALVLAGLLLSVTAFGGAWALAPDRTTQPTGANVNATNTSVLVGVQGPREGGSVAKLHPNGTVAWRYWGGTNGGAISYQSVQRLEDGTVFTSFADDGYSRCGGYEPPCKRTGTRLIDPGPRPHVVNQWSYPIRTREDSEVHDAELLPSGNVLVADMEYESIFVYNRSTGERVWTWNASEHYHAPPEPPKHDWLHINDVDRIGQGRYLVSVRNTNQLVIVERGEGVVEVINADRDPDVLNRQHNPHWLGPGRVLVADSENDRVVELQRNGTTGEWEVTWSLTSAGGIPFEWPRDADRLPNGNTVITDSRNDRVVVVDENGTVVRSYATAPLPYEADVLPYGEQPGVSADEDGAREGSLGRTSYELPVVSTVLAAAHHVVAVPFWVTGLHVLVLAVTLVLWVSGGWLVVRGLRG